VNYDPQLIRDMRSPRRMQAFLREQGLIARKQLGQHFLVNGEILAKIAAAAGGEPGEILLEVGPGYGFLTVELLERSLPLYVVEKDPACIRFLKKSLGDCSLLHVIDADFLKVDLAREVPEAPLVIAANLPYNITSPAFARFLEFPRTRRLVTTIQRQVAERIVAAPGDKAWGAFSVFCRFYAEPELLFHISPGQFHPAPSVYSSVVRLTTRTPPLEGREREWFFRVVKSIFTSRRKTLSNSLRRSPFLALDDLQTAAVLEQAGVAGTVRGEDLTMPVLCDLGRAAAAVAVPG
jgi:16S rRNA (adenine1518-N6/adenine1519-N6)-dimethyltransferase